MGKNTATANYFKRQLVWVYTAHYPCWPGIIQQVRKHKEIIIYRVKLINAQRSYCAYMTEAKMTPYQHLRVKFLEEQKNEHKLFRGAFKNAQAIFSRGEAGGIVKKKKSKSHKDTSLEYNKHCLTQESTNTRDQEQSQKKQYYNNSSESLSSPEESEQISEDDSQQEEEGQSSKSKRNKKGKELGQKQIKKQSKIKNGVYYSRKMIKTNENQIFSKRKYDQDDLYQSEEDDSQKKIEKSQPSEPVRDLLKKEQTSLQNEVSSELLKNEKKQKISQKQKLRILQKYTKILKNKNFKFVERFMIATALLKNMQQSQIKSQKFIEQSLKWINSTKKEIVLSSYEKWKPESASESQGSSDQEQKQRYGI